MTDAERRSGSRPPSSTQNATWTPIRSRAAGRSARISKIDDFIVKLAAKFDQMQAAYANGDWERPGQKLAHWLKGRGTVGFDCFTRPSSKLEQQALRQDNGPATLTRLQELVDRVGRFPSNRGIRSSSRSERYRGR